MDAQLRVSHKSYLKWPTIDFQHIKLSCVESPLSYIPSRLRGSLGLPCDSSTSSGRRGFLPNDIKHLSCSLCREYKRNALVRQFRRKALIHLEVWNISRASAEMDGWSGSQWGGQIYTRYLVMLSLLQDFPHSSTLHHMAIITSNVWYACVLNMFINKTIMPVVRTI